MKTQGTPIGCFDPEGLVFAAGIDNSTIKLYDLRSFDKGAYASWQLPIERSPDTEWTKLEFSKDGQQVNIFF
jgi:COMPASS component SWD2